MATILRKMPPPPPIAQNDPTFNRWLHDLMSFIKDGGGIDTGVIPGYDTLVSTVALHTTQISSLTGDVSSLHSQVSVNTTNIAINAGNINSLFSITSTNTANINALAARPQIRNGSGAPTAGLGANGDWYANTSAPFGVYVKVSGNWMNVAN